MQQFNLFKHCQALHIGRYTRAAKPSFQLGCRASLDTVSNQVLWPPAENWRQSSANTTSHSGLESDAYRFYNYWDCPHTHAHTHTHIHIVACWNTLYTRYVTRSWSSTAKPRQVGNTPWLQIKLASDESKQQSCWPCVILLYIFVVIWYVRIIDEFNCSFENQLCLRVVSESTKDFQSYVESFCRSEIAWRKDSTRTWMW